MFFEKKKSFSNKYEKHVQQKSWRWRLARWMTFTPLLGRDCLIPLLPATDCHHLHYRNLGHELPIRDLVPLNRFTHQIVEDLKMIVPQAVLAWGLRLAYLFWVGLLIAGVIFLSWYILTHIDGCSPNAVQFRVDAFG